MKGKALCVLFVMLLLAIVFSGCTEDDININKNTNTNSEVDRFVGTWVGKHGTVSFQDNETWTFYQNRSLKIVEHEWYEVKLGSYQLDGEELEISIPNVENPSAIYTMWYYYKFFNNDTKLQIENDINLIGEFIKQV